MLHNRISNLMPQLQPPQFTTRNLKENSIELEYRSTREGLVPMLFGLIRGLGKRFELDVRVEHFEKKVDENGCHVFLITW
jgi:hypothetical protein